MTLPRFGIINGPNLNLLGSREVQVYGTTSLNDLCSDMRREFIEDAELEFYQSNHEGGIIDFIHGCLGRNDGIVINPGAYSHSSIAIHDAILAVNIPTVEVHITNIFSRESMRHQCLVAGSCVGLISGFGAYSYSMAVYALLARVNT